MNRLISAVLLFVILAGSSLAEDKLATTIPPGVICSPNKILFMGDSITHAGHYVAWIEAQLRTNQKKGPYSELINLGLPSETCSGLSEPDHPFPRPDVHERLERALEKIKPDVVFACYGMNDGIYYPFSEERFEAYKKGIAEIIRKVDKSGAKLILMTPPAFDPLPLKKAGKLRPLGAEKYAWFAIYEGYDDVLKKYSDWLLTQRDKAFVIDLHTPVTKYVEAKRKKDPDFTMSPDGVHVNNEGHVVLAKAILTAAKEDFGGDPDPELLKLVDQKTRLLHDAWLSHVGHKRPGVKAGLPIDEAKKKAAELEAKIQAATAE
jgi:lysophospholipase L1-like esterase